MAWLGFKYCLDLFSTTGVWVRQTDVLSILGLTVRPLIQNTNDTTLKKVKIRTFDRFLWFSFNYKNCFCFLFVWKINLFFFFCATWCHLASTFLRVSVSSTRPAKERKSWKRQREREREREKSEKQQTTIHTERENTRT